MAKINLKKGESQNTKINLRKNIEEPVVASPLPIDNDSSDTHNTSSNKSKILGIGIGLIIVLLGFFLCKPNTSSKLTEQPKLVNNTLPPKHETHVQDTPIKPQKPVNTSVPLQPVRVEKTGYINGNDVILRSSPSVSSARLGELKKLTKVTILDTIYGRSSNDAVLVRRAYLNYNGGRITLEPGLAVKVNQKDGSKYICTIEVDNKPVRINNVDSSDIRFIEGERWYKVRLNDYKEGYIFGTYVTEYKSLKL